MYVRWTSRLYRKPGSLEKSGYFLSDLYGDFLEDMIIISRPRRMLNTQSLDGNPREYSAFKTYPDLYEYMKGSHWTNRIFHEFIPEDSKQKPRFDIDVDREKYEETVKEFPFLNVLDFVAFGDYIKDITITSACIAMLTLGVTPDITKDFMVFQSHSENKRSYHIIMNRYYHCGWSQAMSFYDICASSSGTGENKALFLKFVDRAVLERNKTLRMNWCIKEKNGNRRVKMYSPTFNYKMQEYTHVISKKGNVSGHIILAHSLVTFTSESEPFPVIKLKMPIYERSDDEIEDNVFEECKNIISLWDKNKSFEVIDCNNGIINMSRLKVTYCQICNRCHSRNPFCYINDAKLYWHCGRAKGVYGILIGNLNTRTSDLKRRLELYKLNTNFATKELLDISIKDNVPVTSEKFKMAIDGKELERKSNKQKFKIITDNFEHRVIIQPKLDNLEPTEELLRKWNYNEIAKIYFSDKKSDVDKIEIKEQISPIIPILEELPEKFYRNNTNKLKFQSKYSITFDSKKNNRTAKAPSEYELKQNSKIDRIRSI
jgi:hypothetical protein